MPRPTRPPFPRRQVGRSLRRLRERAGLTQSEAGEPIRISKSKLSRIEQGHLPGYNDFLALLDRYGVLASEYEEYVRMLDQAKEPGWWPRNPPRDFGYVGAEASASRVRGIEVGLVPGLLQTEAYARRVFEDSAIPWTGDQVTAMTEVRTKRQRRLCRDPDFRVHLIIDEVALRPPRCPRAQLERIIERTALPNLVVQVVPCAAGLHIGLSGGFTILDFPDPEEPGLVYTCGGFGALHLDRPKEIAEAHMQFKHLAKVALGEVASIEFLKRLAVAAEPG
ncbi:Helix-turn-helix domain-containing protein [Amycolatopsis pretoriensis]|uniref:Helix-turn-helix domain-containing protein n=1 Tax=Amycolatopsis pretoriensis TaxID=218821 RepID=A0A1H5QVW0_9PSEU|nr:helix-turn-helix transcriptional regulator [Amycolatopsis pretoriensis]SEF30282.1 Helix-turn-helix domain-containing protein [Amycolatopsis pretoriensis]